MNSTDIVLGIALAVAILAIPFTIGYRTVASTRTRRWIGAFISWLLFFGFVGLTAWALGAVIGKHKARQRARALAAVA